MAINVFLKIGDIEGESLDAKHKGEVEVLSWSWGVLQTKDTGTGGGGRAGKPSFSDFNFTHHIDKASPLLMAACATGKRIKDATIINQKAGEEQREFLIIKMNGIIITSVQPALSGGESVVESVSLKFANVDLEYRPQKADGSLDAGVHFKYDIKAG